MIKVRLLKESLLNEVSIRYYTERFKFPQAFAEFFNSKHRVVGDAMAAIFVEFMKSTDPDDAAFIKDPNISEEDKIKKLKDEYENFSYTGDADKIDQFLTRFPRRKEELIRIAKGQDFDEFMGYFENIYEEEFNTEVIEKDKKGTIMTFDDGFYWTNLGKSFCDVEAKRMRHCGRAMHGDGILYSLRDSGNKPYVTIEKSKTYNSIYQIKGNANNFPNEKYWSYIYSFFDHFGITQLDIEERFATSDRKFMHYFKIGDEESFEAELDAFEYMQVAILRAETADTRQEVIDNFFERFKKLIKKYSPMDLRIDQMIDMFYILYLGLNKYQAPYVIVQSFFKEYVYFSHKPIDYDMELCEEIVDYIEKDGKLDAKNAEYIEDSIKYELQIIDRLADKLQISEATAERAVNSYPLVSKLRKIFSPSEPETQKENLFRMNSKGHFEYVKG